MKLYETSRRRANLPAIVLSLLGPCVFFGIIFWLLSFTMHYKHPQLCWFVIALGALFTAIIGFMAYNAWRKSWGAKPTLEPTWYTFIFFTMVLAWILGVLLGSINFESNMHPYYHITNLNTYPNIDPAKMSGQQLVDAGRVMFTRESKINKSLSIGFQSGSIYCVAPIVSSTERLASYDFWAVGVNCCDGDKPDFHCGQHGNPSAHAGTRLMSTDQRAFFQLAVTQAEVAYRIQALHPLFFLWTEDPLADSSKYQNNGLKFYLFWLMMFFAIQLFMVIATKFGTT